MRYPDGSQSVGSVWQMLYWCSLTDDLVARGERLKVDAQPVKAYSSTSFLSSLFLGSFLGAMSP
jgi:hypothetical protein